jgi:predicted dehydrogenase
MAQRFHIKTLSKMENAVLVALCDTREEITREIASKYDIETVYNDYKELLANEEIEAVVISTPPESHFRILEDAAKAGKHIFVEKPLATMVEECKKAIEVCRSNRVKLTVGLMRRFDKALIWSKEKIDSGDLGKSFAINSTYNHVSTYADYLQKTDADMIGKGGSSTSYKKNRYIFLINHLIHHADIMRWMGGSVERLLATGVFNDDHFSLNVILKFFNKCTGYVQFNSPIKTDWQETLLIHGTRGSLYIKMFFPYLDTPSNTVFVSHEIGSRTSPLIVVNTMYEDELQHFLNCIVNNLEPEPNGYQALEAQKIISAIEKSLEHESWIEIE